MADSNVRYGAYIFVIASVQFIAAMLIAQLAYPCYHGICYNDMTNPISDLGNTVTSPLFYLFDISIMLFGLMLFLGSVLIRYAFPKGLLRGCSVLALMVAAVGSFGVGLFPENTILAIHSFSALVAFAMSGLGILLLGILMVFRGKRKYWQYTFDTLLSGALPLLLLLFYLIPSGGIHSAMAMSGPGFGFGGVERAIAFPPILWVLITGLYLVKWRLS